eukprot:TRINITY_DN1186_c0_g1_i2.p1 TRINITY_DN1186_c0_g1~~TRINITY_DN1186_c0_g1_i2.p1  ORF type:complete len:140 (+),score=8.13 TRINITY_DN1186_c0_g1_i2:152-571(+)
MLRSLVGSEMCIRDRSRIEDMGVSWIFSDSGMVIARAAREMRSIALDLTPPHFAKALETTAHWLSSPYAQALASRPLRPASLAPPSRGARAHGLGMAQRPPACRPSIGHADHSHSRSGDDTSRSQARQLPRRPTRQSPR